MGYSDAQIHDLEATIRASNAEFVVDGSPVNLGRLVHVGIPILPVSYDFEDGGGRVRDRLEALSRTFPARS